MVPVTKAHRGLAPPSRRALPGAPKKTAHRIARRAQGMEGERDFLSGRVTCKNRANSPVLPACPTIYFGSARTYWQYAAYFRIARDPGWGETRRRGAKKTAHRFRDGLKVWKEKEGFFPSRITCKNRAYSAFLPARPPSYPQIR